MEIWKYFILGSSIALVSATTSKCILSKNKVSEGPTWNCTDGHAALLGTYLNIAVHRAGSLGANYTSPVSYYPTPFGVLADFSKIGFENSFFAGDYVTPGLPLEGWVIQYSANGKSVTNLNYGNMNLMALTPTQISITSNASTLSVMWIGQTAQIEMRQVYHLQLESLHFHVSTTLKNIGDSTMSSLYFMRSMDPDPEYHLYEEYWTYNYVKYQPGYAAYTNSELPNAAFVCAAGYNNMDFFAGLGTVDPRARTKHFETKNTNPSQMYAETTWLNYGGKDVLAYDNYTDVMYFDDVSIHMVYNLGTLAPGAITNFDYTYVFRKTDINLALQEVATVILTQPTDIISGSSAVLQAMITNKDLQLPATCTFYLATGTDTSNNSFIWSTIGTIAASVYNATSESLYCTTTFNSTYYSDGYAQLRVLISAYSSVTLKAVSFEKNKIVSIGNTGNIMNFTKPNTNNSYSLNIYRSTTLTLTALPSSTTTYNTVGIRFYLEYYYQGYQRSTYLASTTSGTKAITIIPSMVTGLIKNTQVFIKANIISTSATKTGNYTTSVVFGALINTDIDPTISPTRIPTYTPSRSPTRIPTAQPTRQPTRIPTVQPTRQPTRTPTVSPTRIPSIPPSKTPTYTPSLVPSKYPTLTPTLFPTIGIPTSQPTSMPSKTPSSQPTNQPTSQPTSQPTQQHTDRPTGQPSRQPINVPTISPITRPTSQPSNQPTQQPTSQPKLIPTNQPSSQPSSQPSAIPTTQPTVLPTIQPSTNPTNQPSSQPTYQPLFSPSAQPSSRPSHHPSCSPTNVPTTLPTTLPTQQPSISPTNVPSVCPSMIPSAIPSSRPSCQPTTLPSILPTGEPSEQPTSQPSEQPSAIPTTQPTTQPTQQPSEHPTNQPSSYPSQQPSSCPTNEPTTLPTTLPTQQPSMIPSSAPSSRPSEQPMALPSAWPTNQPSDQPTNQPSEQPSCQPFSMPSAIPTTQPTALPTLQPSTNPTDNPSSQPSRQPSCSPTNEPITLPTSLPTHQPSISPSKVPSSNPSEIPSAIPSSRPSCQPTTPPSTQPASEPSSQPSTRPTAQSYSNPTTIPSIQPTQQSSNQPSVNPADTTFEPTSGPSYHSSCSPTNVPTTLPTTLPTQQPSISNSHTPSVKPSVKTSDVPSSRPSRIPTTLPSILPTSEPSEQPNNQPSCQPSCQPSAIPTTQPTTLPTQQPSEHPTHQPSARLSQQPSSYPTKVPSTLPTSLPTQQPSMIPSANPSSRPSEQPTVLPSAWPTYQPSSQPSEQSSNQISSTPTMEPSYIPPEARPTHCPSSQPTSWHPTCQPSHSTTQPSFQLKNQSTSIPTVNPSARPSYQISEKPTYHPTTLTNYPSMKSITQMPQQMLTSYPTTTQTVLSVNSSTIPSLQPSSQPDTFPSSTPTHLLTEYPSNDISAAPSLTSTFYPSRTAAAQSPRPSKSPSQYPIIVSTLSPFNGEENTEKPSPSIRTNSPSATASFNVSTTKIILLDIFPNHGSTAGGRSTNTGTIIRLRESNISDHQLFSSLIEISILFGNVVVANEDIIRRNKSSIEFYTPSGIGTNNEVLLMINNRTIYTESGQPLYFHYDAPTITSLDLQYAFNISSNPSERMMYLWGSSFGSALQYNGVRHTRVYIALHPEAIIDTVDNYPRNPIVYRDGDDNSHFVNKSTVDWNDPLSFPQSCEIIQQNDTYLACLLPSNLGTNIRVIVTVGEQSVIQQYRFPAPYNLKLQTNVARLYNSEKIASFSKHSASTASAEGEVVHIYGDNFGFLPQNTQIFIIAETNTTNTTSNYFSHRAFANFVLDNDSRVEFSNLCETISFWIWDTEIDHSRPFIKCPTKRLQVGSYRVVVEVAGSRGSAITNNTYLDVKDASNSADSVVSYNSTTLLILPVQCPVGYYGQQGEFCTPCSDSNQRFYSHSMLCPLAGMTEPLPEAGWYIANMNKHHPRCSVDIKTSLTSDRQDCPISWPCIPSYSCQQTLSLTHVQANSTISTIQMADTFQEIQDMSTCSEEYTGYACFSCTKGHFRARLGGGCLPCSIAYAGLVLTCLTCFGIAYFLVYRSMYPATSRQFTTAQQAHINAIRISFSAFIGNKDPKSTVNQKTERSQKPNILFSWIRFLVLLECFQTLALLLTSPLVLNQLPNSHGDRINTNRRYNYQTYALLLSTITYWNPTIWIANECFWSSSTASVLADDSVDTVNQREEQIYLRLFWTINLLPLLVSLCLWISGLVHYCLYTRQQPVSISNKAAVAYNHSASGHGTMDSPSLTTANRGRNNHIYRHAYSVPVKSTMQQTKHSSQNQQQLPTSRLEQHRDSVVIQQMSLTSSSNTSFLLNAMQYMFLPLSCTQPAWLQRCWWIFLLALIVLFPLILWTNMSIFYCIQFPLYIDSGIHYEGYLPYFPLGSRQGMCSNWNSDDNSNTDSTWQRYVSTWSILFLVLYLFIVPAVSIPAVKSLLFCSDSEKNKTSSDNDYKSRLFPAVNPQLSMDPSHLVASGDTTTTRYHELVVLVGGIIIIALYRKLTVVVLLTTTNYIDETMNNRAVAQKLLGLSVVYWMMGRLPVGLWWLYQQHKSHSIYDKNSVPIRAINLWLTIQYYLDQCLVAIVLLVILALLLSSSDYSASHRHQQGVSVAVDWTFAAILVATIFAIFLARYSNPLSTMLFSRCGTNDASDDSGNEAATHDAHTHRIVVQSSSNHQSYSNGHREHPYHHHNHSSDTENNDEKDDGEEDMSTMSQLRCDLKETTQKGNQQSPRKQTQAQTTEPKKQSSTTPQWLPSYFFPASSPLTSSNNDENKDNHHHKDAATARSFNARFPVWREAAVPGTRITQNSHPNTNTKSSSRDNRYENPIQLAAKHPEVSADSWIQMHDRRRGGGQQKDRVKPHPLPPPLPTLPTPLLTPPPPPPDYAHNTGNHHSNNKITSANNINDSTNENKANQRPWSADWLASFITTTPPTTQTKEEKTKAGCTAEGAEINTSDNKKCTRGGQRAIQVMPMTLKKVNVVPRRRTSLSQHDKSRNRVNNNMHGHDHSNLNSQASAVSALSAASSAVLTETSATNKTHHNKNAMSTAGGSCKRKGRLFQQLQQKLLPKKQSDVHTLQNTNGTVMTGDEEGEYSVSDSAPSSDSDSDSDSTSGSSSSTASKLSVSRRSTQPCQSTDPIDETTPKDNSHSDLNVLSVEKKAKRRQLLSLWNKKRWQSPVITALLQQNNQRKAEDHSQRQNQHEDSSGAMDSGKNNGIQPKDKQLEYKNNNVINIFNSKNNLTNKNNNSNKSHISQNYFYQRTSTASKPVTNKEQTGWKQVFVHSNPSCNTAAKASSSAITLGKAHIQYHTRHHHAKHSSNDVAHQDGIDSSSSNGKKLENSSSVSSSWTIPRLFSVSTPASSVNPDDNNTANKNSSNTHASSGSIIPTNNHSNKNTMINPPGTFHEENPLRRESPMERQKSTQKNNYNTATDRSSSSKVNISPADRKWSQQHQNSYSDITSTHQNPSQKKSLWKNATKVNILREEPPITVQKPTTINHDSTKRAELINKINPVLQNKQQKQKLKHTFPLLPQQKAPAWSDNRVNYSDKNQQIASSFSINNSNIRRNNPPKLIQTGAEEQVEEDYAAHEAEEIN